MRTLPTTAPRPDAKIALRVDWKPGEFDAVIEQQGYRLRWERASRCACSANVHTDQPHPNCPVCGGSGWEYHTPAEIRGIVTALDRNPDLLIAFGQAAFGQARITVRPEHRPGYYHRFTVLDSVLEHTERRARKAGREALRFPIACITDEWMVQNAGGIDERREVELDVLRLRVEDPATRQPGPVLVCGEDFDVTDGRLDWTKGDLRGTAPADGGAYSVTYLHHPRFVVQSLPFAARLAQVRTKKGGGTGSVPLPVAALCRAEHFPKPGAAS